MARHGLHKRAPQINPPGNAPFSSGLPSIITAPSADDGQAASLTFATSASALTTITTDQEFIVSATGGTGFSTRTDQVTSTITDPAQYAALTASEAQATSPSSRASSSTPSASSTAASSKSSSNTSTLIPAIVVPIVVVLLASFAAFWFWMRRRHRRELKSTDFVMAGKGEKLSSRTNSSRSGGTGTSTVEKSGPMVSVSEFKPPHSFQPQAPKISMEDIGVARPLTPKDGAGQGSPRRPNDRYGRPSNEQRSYQNFSGPRPNTARDRGPPPTQPPQGRNRSNSSPNKRGPPPSAFDRSRGPLPGRPSPEFRGAPSPVPRQGPGPSPIPNTGVFPLTRGLPMNPRPAPAPPQPMREPSPSMDHTSRAAAPPSLNAPPPGAFNGASPISQYSPIVKEAPTIGIGAIPGSNAFAGKPQTSDGSRVPPPIATRNLTSTETSRSPSPSSPSGNFLTEENMRIARLANSSRLGFFNTSATSPSANNAFDKAGSSTALKPLAIKASSAPGQSPATTSNPSPKLPPPATRSQLIPNDSLKDTSKSSGQYNYFANPPATYSKGHSPASSFHSAPNNVNGTSNLPHSYAPTTVTYHHRPTTAGTGADRHHPQPHPHHPHHHHNDRHHHERQREDDEESNVSDLDAYEDIDAKSDVSSLNEFERFEFESRNGSQRGSGSVRGLGFDSPDRGGYRR